MRPKVWIFAIVLLLAANGFAASLPECVPEFNFITTTINGVTITTPNNNATTAACVNCCDRIVVTAPAGAEVNVKWAAAWTYSGATSGANFCNSGTRRFSYPTAVKDWLDKKADREVYDYDEKSFISTGDPITVNICHTILRSEWKSPEIHIDFRVNVVSSLGVPLVTDFGGTGGWDPYCLNTGCTPGFWKTHLEVWPSTGYAPADSFETIFGVAVTEDLRCGPATPGASLTLLEGLGLGGGGECALIRHSIAALLNSSSAGTQPLWCGQIPFYSLGYPYTSAQVIQQVKEAYAWGDFESVKNAFVAANETMCGPDDSPRWFGYNSCTDQDEFCNYWLNNSEPILP